MTSAKVVPKSRFIDLVSSDDITYNENEINEFIKLYLSSFASTLSFIKENNYSKNIINTTTSCYMFWKELFTFVVENFNVLKDINVYNKVNNCIEVLMDSTKSVYSLIGKETVDKLNNKDLLYDDKTKEFQYEYNVITVCILNYFNA